MTCRSTFCEHPKAPGQYLGVATNLGGVTTVILPGTGSDDDYIIRAFSRPLRDAGAQILAPRPQPDHLLSGYLTALDNAAGRGPIAVGGVSIGAAVAAAWALQHPDRAVAVLAALPAWTGAPGDAAAALAAPHRRPALRATAAPRRSGRNDQPDAGVQSAVVGRRADPVMAEPVAASAGRHGGSG